MKKMIVLLITIVVFTSCNTSDGIVFPDSYGENPPSEFSVNFDNQIFTADNSEYSIINGDLFITGIKTNTDEVFTLKVVDFDLGTFTFEGDLENTATYILNDPVSANIWTTANQPSSFGQIIVTEINTINNTISGTFGFKGIHQNGTTKEFTDGKLTNIPLRVAPVTNNSFSAKINGVNYANDGLSTALVSVGTNDIIMINATKRSTGEILSISLPLDVAVGEHNFNFISNPPLGQYTLDGGIHIADGKINVLSHDIANKTITATFNFDASPPVATTPNFEVIGEFDVNY